MEPDQRSAPPARELARELESNLVPGLRNRLIAELAVRDIPPDQYTPYLANLTGRVPQTVKRWLKADRPGLPDLASLALLGLQLDLDPDWLLGLQRHRAHFPHDRLPGRLLDALYPDGDAPADWIGALQPQLGIQPALKAAIMRGPEMAPLIRDGAPFFFDDTHTHVSCNGIYLLQHNGQQLVRHVERRIGEGLLLRCENPAYADTLLADADGANTSLAVHGRVRLVLQVTQL
ncbi:MAG: S24 family peptidase [Burkholderiaceae bacterium]|nr:S24 family peptidase [Burkholderiaceae bacterium]